MFTNIKDEYQILNDMMELTIVDTTKSAGGLLYDALAPCANQLAEQYMDIRSNLSRSFLEYADGKYLDMKAKEHGVDRKQGSKATAKVNFEGISGTIIPIGFNIQTQSEIIYETIDSYTINESGYCEGYVRAIEIGENSNVEVGMINKIPVALTGLLSVVNIEKASGGSGVEEDEAFLERTLQKIQNPATSGNPSHYKSWAMEHNSVGDAKVYPIWNGPGTVKVVIVDANKEPANDVVVKEVYDYIETERPIGATVTVESAKKLIVNIESNVTIESSASLSKIRLEAQEKINDYIKSTVFKNEYISIGKIGALLFSIDGIVDYSTIKINGKSSNLAIGDTQVPVLGGVIIND